MGGRVAPMEYRISVFEPPTRVILTGRGLRRHRGRRHPLRAGRRRDARRLHRRHQARWVPRAHPAVAGPRVRQPGPERRRRHAADARRARCGGRDGSAMKVAIVGAGVSGLQRGICPARHARDPPVRWRVHGRRARKDRRRRDRRGPIAVDTGFIVYNEPTYPAFTGLLAELGVRPSRARCRWARPVEPATSSSARAACAASSPSRPPSPARLSGACSRTSGASTAEARRRSMPRRPPRHARRLPRGRWLRRGFRDHFLGRRSCPPSGPPAPPGSCEFPVDYLLRFLDNHGLIGFGRALRGGPSRAGRCGTWSGSSRRLPAVRSVRAARWWTSLGPAPA